MAIERILDPEVIEEDRLEAEVKEEVTLRPSSFDEYIGQEKIKKNLKLAISAAKKRGDCIDHVLLYGPPGLGKTTMANVIAKEMGVSLRVTSGPAVEKAGDLASILTNLQDGDILFIDEIHRLPRTVEEILYSAMEDYKLDIIIGKGPAARSVRLDLPRFTVIGATTKTGSLSAPLRDRFGHIYRLEFYTPSEISLIITRSAKILGIDITAKASSMLSTRARLTPRIANRLIKRVRDYAEVNGGIVDEENTKKALKMLEIDELGLDSADRNLISSVIENYNTRPVGLNTMAALTGDEPSTIEDFYEPYLMQIGFIHRTPRGRIITRKAFNHLGKEWEDGE
ncbi:Holliday junction branch migration DNA helicase RuvB [Candidatus Nanogingivalis gingivitcus]|jgi:holliday junction DNA helicase ruvB|uniref:Holliday junction branch migration complex subunit RuvB n=1 Tax=Candidatus Nanogingivalis gingivitcus TaxID=2171992 RepID=A0ABY0FJB0_9BACT|nr:Holliday junction branch migration DNA helicase RuvB [Candidatus Nanogingivalis gingivitcus]RYC73012.1 Holliday junction ATP-dependent DNA helicase RuvB [Candidatus Nanogingivalis gingivitcus]